MVRKFAQVLILFCFVASGLLCGGASLTSPSTQEDDLVKKVVDRAKQNEELADRLGFYQVTAIKKMSDGKIASENRKMHKIIWIEDQPYLELIKINGFDLNEKQQKEEAERRSKFIKSLRKKSEKQNDQDEPVQWDDLYAKYDFERLPADTIAPYVFSFKPKKGKLEERSRAEKVFNHVAGTFWADEHFNIVRAEAKLLENVRFGLGILGNIEKFQMRYEQQSFDQVQVPAYLFIHFKARVALVKTEERQIQATYTDFFYRPNATLQK